MGKNGQCVARHNIRRLRDTLLYLVEWVPSFQWNNVLPSVIVLMLAVNVCFTALPRTARLFVRATLHIPSSSLKDIGEVLISCAGIPGALLWPAVQHCLHLTPLRMLILLTVQASASRSHQAVLAACVHGVIACLRCT